MPPFLHYAAAHIDGANGDTMNMFANLCGIPHYGGSISC